MGHNSGDLFQLMGDILATARLDDRARFTQMVAETKAGLEAGIIGSGHRCAVQIVQPLLIHSCCTCTAVVSWHTTACNRSHSNLPIGFHDILTPWCSPYAGDHSAW
eukprot:GHRR01037420.1.p1 GENE.GHRR01037420.1~~GHRR01037420.1.p1  ORF type:complete len:106 (-),score=15.42 GHRR01037420.1:24-341(-)